MKWKAVRWVASHRVGGKKQTRADKTSVESRGSKKSKRIRGLSPSADIPEDAGEEKDGKQEETMSVALEAVLATDD